MEQVDRDVIAIREKRRKQWESLGEVDRILCYELVAPTVEGTWEHNTPPKRKPFSKKTKEEVLHKFGDRCSYCGCPLTIKTVQVDHICPVHIYGDNKDISNLIPSCRYCNFFKSTDSINSFRRHLMRMIGTMHKKDATFRMMERFGFIDLTRPPVHFWFEEYIEGKETAMANAFRRMGCYD